MQDRGRSSEIKWMKSIFVGVGVYSGGGLTLNICYIQEEKPTYKRGGNFFLYDSEYFFGKGGGGEEYIRDLGKVIFLNSVGAERGSFPFMLEVFWYYFPFQNTLFISYSQFLMC